ncbi:putative signal transducing protein [Sphingobacterium psychroaquaticum]|uniref:Putative signal transducing protein n=1 Tax=Sphingobacterium psychroaquaticum TaxID=561061 RepID=A0A1X7LDH1_9SPHI|nr:DUF2007 domain-containing protein [Sphingobacterium psychroaquaticum]QBQ40698.1 DUF2007 domain-containing protein [Sphingobacterium psychroaquaticum]SMG51891.1 Putative signal transducing protein [Sphingobacterium psychroaquaticum]
MEILKTFDNPIDAHLLKSKLESEDIACYILDENIVGLNPLLNIAVGGIKLMVAAADLDRARLVLQEIDNTPLLTDQDVAIRCPECGSTNIFNNIKNNEGTRGILATVLSFITMTYPIYTKKSYLCRDCDKVFN